MDWHVIVNPTAGGGKGGMKWPIIKDELIRQGFNFTSVISERKDHIYELSESAAAQGVKNFIVVGGDGSLLEVVNGILKQKNLNPEEISIGHIPVGTGNDWGKMYGNTTDFRKSIQIIKSGKLFRQDIGVIHFVNENRKIYFVNIAGLGFDAEVLKEVWRQKEKGRDGKLIYLLMLLKTLYRSSFHEIALAFPQKTENHFMFSMTIGVGRYNGNGMMQLPFSNPADGKLDVSIINKINKAEVLLEVKNLYNGTFVKNKHVSIKRTDKVFITSAKQVPIEADGEFLGYTPVEISLIPACINFFVNQTNFEINPKIKDYAPDII